MNPSISDALPPFKQQNAVMPGTLAASLAVLLSLLTVIVGLRPLDSKLVSECDGDLSERRLQACTKLIATGQLSKEERAVVLSRRAAVFASQENFTAAANDLDEARILAPDDQTIARQFMLAQLYLGDENLLSKQYLQAVNAYSKALQIDPGNTNALLARAGAYISVGQEEEAISDLDRIHTFPASAKPTVAAFFERRARESHAKLNLVDARKFYTKAIALVDGPKSTLLVGRAQVLERQGELDAALADFTLALDELPLNIMAFSARGDVYLAQGQASKALSDFDSALAAFPNDLSLIIRKALVEEMLGRANEARDDFERALKLDAQNKTALEGISRLGH